MITRQQLFISGTIIALVIGGVWLTSAQTNKEVLASTTVSRETVTQVVAVTGYLEADQAANLAFPRSGRVTDIAVAEGEEVNTGDLLASVSQSGLEYDRRAAAAAVTQAIAARDALLNGQTNEEYLVTEATVSQARAALNQTISSELAKVQQAEIALRSSGLQAQSTDDEEDTTTPVISGSYTCAEEGVYTIDVYSSQTDSGYSFRYDGLESGVATVNTSRAIPFGACGLSIEFAAEENYANTTWTISIPNYRSNSYSSLQTTLAVTEATAEKNIAAAKEALALAEASAAAAVAGPRIEAVLDANAAVEAARSALASIDAKLADYAIFAPFNGIVSDISITVGEVATVEPVLTMVGDGAYTLIALIPEIDITTITEGQIVTAVFDAKLDTTLTGTIIHIAPSATEIEGVAYFEAKIKLDETPAWLRNGLNADVDITTARAKDVLSLPQSYIDYASENTPRVTTLVDDKEVERTIELGLKGTDGLVEVLNLPEGMVILAP